MRLFPQEADDELIFRVQFPDEPLTENALAEMTAVLSDVTLILAAEQFTVESMSEMVNGTRPGVEPMSTVLSEIAEIFGRSLTGLTVRKKE